MGDNLTDDVRIREIEEVIAPKRIIDEIPISAEVSELVVNTRENIRKIIHGLDDRLLLIVGPCSIHDPEAAMDYAKRLLEERDKYKDSLELIMRVYFEKPRTTVGWKGLINDPDLNNSFDINKGLRVGRRLLFEINNLRNAGRSRIFGCNFSTIYCGPCFVGSYWGAYDRISNT